MLLNDYFDADLGLLEGCSTKHPNSPNHCILFYLESHVLVDTGFKIVRSKIYSSFLDLPTNIKIAETKAFIHYFKKGYNVFEVHSKLYF